MQNHNTPYPAGDVDDLVKVQDRTAVAVNRRTGELQQLAGLALTVTEAAPNGVVRVRLKNDRFDIDTYLTRRQYEVMMDASEVRKSAEASVREYLAWSNRPCTFWERHREWILPLAILALFLGGLFIAARASAAESWLHDELPKAAFGGQGFSQAAPLQHRSYHPPLVVGRM